MLLLENLKKTIQNIAEVLKLKADKTDIVQSDWAQTDVNNKAFIKNKPAIGGVSGFSYNFLKDDLELDSKYWKITPPTTKVLTEDNEGISIYVPTGQWVTLEYIMSNFEINRSINFPFKLVIIMKAVLGRVKVRETESFTSSYTDYTDFVFPLSLSFGDGSFSKGIKIELYNGENSDKWIPIKSIAVVSEKIEYPLPISNLRRVRNAAPKSPHTNVSNYSNVLYTEPNNYFQPIENTNLPDYYVQHHFITTSGCNVKFNPSSKLTAPDGLELKGLGSYAIVVKTGDKYLLRIHNVTQP